MIYIAGGLFLCLCLTAMGEFNTGNILEQYKANDTKYRFLKLQNIGPLQQLLLVTDSLYRSQTYMLDNVIRQEDSVQDRIQRLQEIETMENQIKD